MSSSSAVVRRGSRSLAARPVSAGRVGASGPTAHGLGFPGTDRPRSSGAASGRNSARRLSVDSILAGIGVVGMGGGSAAGSRRGSACGSSPRAAGRLCDRPGSKRPSAEDGGGVVRGVGNKWSSVEGSRQSVEGLGRTSVDGMVNNSCYDGIDRTSMHQETPVKV